MKDRIQLDDKGGIDEIVVSGGAHLERMDRGHWFLSLVRKDGTSVAIWIKGEITLFEERDRGEYCVSAESA